MKVNIGIDLDEERVDFSIGNKNQGRFYAPKLKIGEDYFFVDFSYVWEKVGSYDDFGYGCVRGIKFGFTLNRQTGESNRGHIWIKDLKTNKRAAPEVYVSFLNEIAHNVIIGWDPDTELNVCSFASDIELSENK